MQLFGYVIAILQNVYKLILLLAPQLVNNSLVQEINLILNELSGLSN